MDKVKIKKSSNHTPCKYIEPRHCDCPTQFQNTPARGKQGWIIVTSSPREFIYLKRKKLNYANGLASIDLSQFQGIQDLPKKPPEPADCLDPGTVAGAAGGAPLPLKP
jgi:hypothetical protein